MVLAVPFLGDAIAPHQVVALAVVVACIYGLTLASLRKRQAPAHRTGSLDDGGPAEPLPIHWTGLRVTRAGCVENRRTSA